MKVAWEKVWGHNELRLQNCLPPRAECDWPKCTGTYHRQVVQDTWKSTANANHTHFLPTSQSWSPEPRIPSWKPSNPSWIYACVQWGVLWDCVMRVHHKGATLGCVMSVMGLCDQGTNLREHVLTTSFIDHLKSWDALSPHHTCTLTRHMYLHTHHTHSHINHTSTLTHLTQALIHPSNMCPHTPITHVPSHTQFSHSPRRWVAMWMRKTSTHSCSLKRESLPSYLETRRPHRQRWVWTISCAEFRSQGLGLTTFVKWLFSTQSSFSSKCKLVCGKIHSLNLHCVRSVQRTIQMSLISHWGTYFLTSFYMWSIPQCGT